MSCNRSRRSPPATGGALCRLQPRQFPLSRNGRWTGAPARSSMSIWCATRRAGWWPTCRARCPRASTAMPKTAVTVTPAGLVADGAPLHRPCRPPPPRAGRGAFAQPCGFSGMPALHTGRGGLPLGGAATKVDQRRTAQRSAAATQTIDGPAGVSNCHAAAIADQRRGPPKPAAISAIASGRAGEAARRRRRDDQERRDQQRAHHLDRHRHHDRQRQRQDQLLAPRVDARRGGQIARQGPGQQRRPPRQISPMTEGARRPRSPPDRSAPPPGCRPRDR